MIWRGEGGFTGFVPRSSPTSDLSVELAGIEQLYSHSACVSHITARRSVSQQRIDDRQLELVLAAATASPARFVLLCHRRMT